KGGSEIVARSSRYCRRSEEGAVSEECGRPSLRHQRRARRSGRCRSKRRKDFERRNAKIKPAAKPWCASSRHPPLQGYWGKRRRRARGEIRERQEFGIRA